MDAFPTKKAPKTRLQRPTILAFQRIVHQSRMPDGGIWWPSKITEELWRLWEEKDVEGVRFVEFHDHFGQRVERLREKVTSARLNDGFLFELIEKFVREHSRHGDYTLPGRDIELIKKTASYVAQFANAQGEISYKNLAKRPLEAEFTKRAKKRSDITSPSMRPDFLMLAIDPIAEFGLRSDHTSAWAKKIELASFSIDPSPTIEFPSRRIIAVSTRSESATWPAALFETNFLLSEIGYFVRDASVFHFRMAIDHADLRKQALEIGLRCIELQSRGHDLVASEDSLKVRLQLSRLAFKVNVVDDPSLTKVGTRLLKELDWPSRVDYV